MIPFKSKLKSFTDIQKRNKAFDALSDEEKRKEIAFDALFLLIKTNKVSASSWHGYWSSPIHRLSRKFKTAVTFQRAITNLEILPKCNVCARGLMMLCQIRLGNTINPYNDESAEDGSSKNLKGFTFDEMTNMEREYEENEYQLPYSRRSKEKLANIACNVIDNGTFDPQDYTDYLNKWKIKLKK